MRLDDRFAPTGQWLLPPELLARLSPYSISGASWSSAGFLAVTGHDRPEIYLVRLPRKPGMAKLEAVVPVTTEGQAIDWEPGHRKLLWSISRRDRALVLSDLSKVVDPGH